MKIEKLTKTAVRSTGGKKAIKVSKGLVVKTSIRAGTTYA
jgi:hypothetical protein